MVSWILFIGLLCFVVLTLVLGIALIVGSRDIQCDRHGQTGGFGDYAMYVSPKALLKNTPCSLISIHTEMPGALVHDVCVTVNGKDVHVDRIDNDDSNHLVVQLRSEEFQDFMNNPLAAIAMRVKYSGKFLCSKVSLPILE